MDARTNTTRNVRLDHQRVVSPASRMFDVYTGLHRKRSPRKALTRFAQVAREAWKETRKCAPQATRLGGSFKALQFFDELYVAFKYEISPPNYYRLSLYRPEHRREVRVYVPTQPHGRFLREVRSALHTPLTDLQDNDAMLPRHDLVAKEALGEFGKGATLSATRHPSSPRTYVQ